LLPDDATTRPDEETADPGAADAAPDRDSRPDTEPDTEPDAEQDAEPDAERARAKEVESGILAAYRELSVKQQDWVRLSKLRAQLSHLDRGEVDRVLLTMIRTGHAHLAPDSNRKAHTEADHTAAMRIGTQDKHLLAIETDYPGI
jgi:hypothetical protein